MKTPLVIVSILGILLMGTPLCHGTEMPSRDQVKTKEEQAKEDIATINTQIRTFEMHNERLPTEEEGIAALVARPDDDLPRWMQLLEAIPKDPWGREYIYKLDADSPGGFIIISQGPDPDTTDDDISH